MGRSVGGEVRGEGWWGVAIAVLLLYGVIMMFLGVVVS